MSGSDEYISSLLETAPLREAIIKDAVKYLDLPEGSTGLDAGCGIGLHLPMLAEAVGKDGHVIGLDMSSKFLEFAQKYVNESNVAAQISFQKGNVNDLPFDDHTFDWVWSVDCIGYARMDLLSVLKELVRVVRPGKLIAVLAYSSQQLLPGYPELEAKLNATPSGIAPFIKGSSPEEHFSRSLYWFEKAGLSNLCAKTFVGEFSAPLSATVNKALLSLITMRWNEAELSSEDMKLFRRLYTPDSPDFILNLPDYYGFITYTMFCGRVPD
jgi:ubiquinone/menaquinone biosynthesis C-methylase UbiE